MKKEEIEKEFFDILDKLKDYDDKGKAKQIEIKFDNKKEVLIKVEK